MKDIYDNPYEYAGILAQTAVDAVSEKLRKICDKTGEDSSFFQVRLTLDLSTLSSDFTDILQTVSITETLNCNLPEGNKA